MQDKKLYNEVGERHKLPTHKVRNALIAFICGGSLAIAAQYLFYIFTTFLELDKANATSAVVIVIIIITSFLTGLGVYDKLAQYCGAGLFIPISGFANSLSSCALEGKSEGLIFGIGSNMFKLAGSVITYGIVSAYIFGLIRYFVGI